MDDQEFYIKLKDEVSFVDLIPFGFVIESRKGRNMAFIYENVLWRRLETCYFDDDRIFRSCGLSLGYSFPALYDLTVAGLVKKVKFVKGEFIDV